MRTKQHLWESDGATFPFYRSSSDTCSVVGQHTSSFSNLLTIHCFPTSWRRNCAALPVPQAPHTCLSNGTLPVAEGPLAKPMHIASCTLCKGNWCCSTGDKSEHQTGKATPKLKPHLLIAAGNKKICMTSKEMTPESQTLHHNKHSSKGYQKFHFGVSSPATACLFLDKLCHFKV